MTYHVIYFYFTTGMIQPELQYMGMVEAASEQEAKRKITPDPRMIKYLIAKPVK